MRIRTAFLLAVSTKTILVALTIWAVAHMYLDTTQAIRTQRVVETIADGGFRVALLTSDFLLHGEVRSERQWRDTRAEMTRLIVENRSQLAPYARSLDEIQAILDDLDTLLARTVVVMRTDQKTGTHLHDDEVYGLLSSQIFIRITELQSVIDSFSLSVHRNVEETFVSSSSSMVFRISGLFVLFILAAAGTSLLFLSRVIAPLSRLESAIIGIEEGQTELRPLKGAQDEIGSVVDAFNSLLDRQQAIEQDLKDNAVLLVRANQELETFVYVASHDLRAPLRGIANLADWIEEDLEGGIEGETQENLDLLKSRVRRMDSLLEGLLQYSRIGRRESRVETLDSGALVAEVIDLLAPPEGFEVVVTLSMPILATQRPPLEMVFRNLIANAIKHHDRSEGRIEVSCRNRGDTYEFSVSDDGPGIAPEYHEKIFGMFQTLKPRDEVEGSGMGLALVKRAVEHVGGSIAVESEPPRRGATFRFTWPVTPCP